MNFKKSHILTIILSFVFIGNSLFGHAFANIVVGFIPLNEILLGISLVLINKNIFSLIKRHKLIIPILCWAFLFLMMSVPIGLSQNGIWALRDATHLFEVFWIIIAIYALERNNHQNFLKKFLLCIPFFLLFKAVSILFKDNFQGIILISGVQGELDLLSSSAGIFVFFFMVLAFLFLQTKIKHRIIAFISFLVILVLFQKRSMFIGVIIMVLLGTVLLKINSRKLIKYLAFSIISFFLLNFFSGISSQILTQNKIEINNMNPHRIFLRLMSSMGESKEFESSAKGTIQRLNWWNSILDKSLSSTSYFLLGRGFGMSLTDFYTTNLVREPHNSYLSIYARTGLLGLSLWLFFHIRINFIAFQLLKKNHILIKKDFNLIILFICLLTLVPMYSFCFVEPGFESPYLCVNLYILLGVLIWAIKNVQINITTSSY